MHTAEHKIAMADETERLIAKLLAKQAGSAAPAIDRTAGAIDLAYEQGFIDYPRRDVLMDQLRVIVNKRRHELLEQRHAKLLRVAQ